MHRSGGHGGSRDIGRLLERYALSIQEIDVRHEVCVQVEVPVGGKQRRPKDPSTGSLSKLVTTVPETLRASIWHIGNVAFAYGFAAAALLAAVVAAAMVLFTMLLVRRAETLPVSGDGSRLSASTMKPTASLTPPSGPRNKDNPMGIVRFALKFSYTFYVLAALILFLGVSSGRVGVSRAPPVIRADLTLQTDP